MAKRSTQPRGIQGDETALRLGPSRRGSRHAQERRPRPARVREAVGNGVDIMTDAYMGWTIDYAKRMLPAARAVQPALLEEPGDPGRHPKDTPS